MLVINVWTPDRLNQRNSKLNQRNSTDFTERPLVNEARPNVAQNQMLPFACYSNFSNPDASQNLLRPTLNQGRNSGALLQFSEQERGATDVEQHADFDYTHFEARNQSRNFNNFVQNEKPCGSHFKNNNRKAYSESEDISYPDNYHIYENRVSCKQVVCMK